MGAPTLPIAEQIRALRADWRELWYAMADGDAAQYSLVKLLDVHEFWSVFDNWKKRVEIQAGHVRNNQKPQKNGR